MSKRFKETLEHPKASTSRTIQSDSSTLPYRNIKVVILRPFLHKSDSGSTIQTSIDDPSTLAVHRMGEGSQPIFSRKDIVVNVEEHLEERIVSASPDRDEEPHTCRHARSRSHSCSEHSTKSYRSSLSKESDRSSRDGSKRRSKTTSKGFLNKRFTELNRKTSVAEYERDDPDYSRRSRDLSPKVGTSKSNRSPPKDVHRKDYRDTPPRRYGKTRSRSRSPRRSGYGKSIGNDKDKYVRPRSRSRSYRRRSRSPYPRKRTPSPHSSKRRSRSPHSSKRRSRSPYTRRTPKRSTRRSKSPYDEKRKYASRPYYKRRTPSPYSRRRSRSPYRYRNRTNTPSSRDSRYHKRDRSRSPQTQKVSSFVEKKSTELPGFKGLHPDFAFYGPDFYWMPGPMPRPGFMPRGVMPAPRCGFRPPYFMPRPYMPFPHPHPNYRPRFTIDYNRPVRSKVSSTTTAMHVQVETAPVAFGVVQATSTDAVAESVQSDTNEISLNVASSTK
ncbi:hypothetical protein RN001_014084 [Aquatica leii]|uniref:Transformer n=1 Tax=Aquatica leii TaxID=1421715 RepID=A0AAN7SEB7_9COLE|nr:hypothetical protein RN001_014084 [Aquatica leii]